MKILAPRPHTLDCSCCFGIDKIRREIQNIWLWENKSGVNCFCSSLTAQCEPCLRFFLCDAWWSANIQTIWFWFGPKYSRPWTDPQGNWRWARGAEEALGSGDQSITPVGLYWLCNPTGLLRSICFQAFCVGRWRSVPGLTLTFYRDTCVCFCVIKSRRQIRGWKKRLNDQRNIINPQRRLTQHNWTIIFQHDL